MDELLLKLAADLVFSAILLLLYNRSTQRIEEQQKWMQGLIEQHYHQAEKSVTWYQSTIGNFTRGAARV